MTATGGEAVSARFPSTQPDLEIDYIRYPRERIRDRLAARVGGRKLHFADYPELAGFERAPR